MYKYIYIIPIVFACGSDVDGLVIDDDDDDMRYGSTTLVYTHTFKHTFP